MDRPLSVGLVSPGWPPSATHNGIVTYVGNLRPGLERAGVGVTILTSALAPGADRSDVVLADSHPPRALRAVLRASSERLPFDTTGLLLALPLARVANDLRARTHLDLLEMEETFGAARYVQRMTEVPVVVRLHGPHFLHAPIVGAAIDPRIARAERRCVAEAAGITAPSRDVLERVRREYQLPLADAVVIPNPAPLVPPERRWSLQASDRKSILAASRTLRRPSGVVHRPTRSCSHV